MVSQAATGLNPFEVRAVIYLFSLSQQIISVGLNPFEVRAVIYLN